MLPFAEIEQGIKDALQALQRPYIAEIKTYGGWFDVGDDREFAQVVSRFPAVWTTFEGAGKPKRLSARKYQMPLTFTVLVGARSIRTEETARHGVTVDGQQVEVGSFQLLNDVVAALLGQKLSACSTALEIGQVNTLFNTKTQKEAVSVLAISWHTDATIVTPDSEAEAADWLERVNIDYLLQPQDDVPDAADLVQLTED